MFKGIKGKLKEIQAEIVKAHGEKIESFNDPMAKTIQWGALARSSCQWHNRYLVQQKSGNIVFYPTLQALLFSGSFLAIGYYVMHVATLKKMSVMAAVLDPIHTGNPLISHNRHISALKA